jgi:hypothetical protein
VSGGTSPDVAGGSGGDGFTAEQLRFSRKDARNLSLICVGALVVCIGMAVFVFTSVPWETRMPYDGKYNRSGSGIPMQIALLPVLVPILGMWRAAARPEKSPRTKAGHTDLHTPCSIRYLVRHWSVDHGRGDSRCRRLGLSMDLDELTPATVVVLAVSTFAVVFGIQDGAPAGAIVGRAQFRAEKTGAAPW